MLKIHDIGNNTFNRPPILNRGTIFKSGFLIKQSMVCMMFQIKTVRFNVLNSKEYEGLEIHESGVINSRDIIDVVNLDIVKMNIEEQVCHRLMSLEFLPKVLVSEIDGYLYYSKTVNLIMNKLKDQNSLYLDEFKLLLKESQTFDRTDKRVKVTFEVSTDNVLNLYNLRWVGYMDYEG
jgi:hypothetical protein